MAFNGITSATPLSYTGVAATDTSNITTALDGLSTIGGVGGSVTVTADPSDTIFAIDFGGSLANSNQPLVEVTLTTPTASVSAGPPQSLTLNGATANSTAFQLSFEGPATAPITYTGVAATDTSNITTALDGLVTIGGAGGSVTVTANANDTVFSINFGGTLAGTTQLIGVNITTPLASVSVGPLQLLTLHGPTANTTAFNLSFNGASTATPITYSGVAATDTSNIANALDGLSTIGGVGGSVTVTANASDTVFTIVFQGALATAVQPLIGATVTASTATATVTTTTTASGLGIAVDASGNVYTTGYFEGTANFDPAGSAGSAAGLLTTSTDGTDFNAYVSKLDTAGNFVWADLLGAGASVDGALAAIAVDAFGNIYTTGQFVGTGSFNPSGMGGTLTSSTSGSDANAYVSRLDSSGNFVWADLLGSGANPAQGTGISVDGAGNIYTSGNFEGTGNFDPGAGTFDLSGTDPSNPAGYLVELANSNPTNLAFALSAGISTDTGTAQGLSDATDAAGDVFITGDFSGSVSFDATTTLTALGTQDAFVAEYSSTGTLDWVVDLGGVGVTQQGNGIVVDGSGDVYTTGTFSGTALFNSGGAFNITSTGGSNAYVTELNSSGNFVWADDLGAGSTAEGNAIALDSSDDVLTTGSFTGIGSFNSTGTADLTSSGGANAYVSKLDSSGNFIWVEQLGAGAATQGNGIAADGSGNVYTTGTFNGMGNFNPGSGTADLTSSGGPNAYVSELDSAGSFVLIEQLGAGASTMGQGIAVDGSGNIDTTGSFNGTGNFNPGSGTADLISSGGANAYVSQLNNAGSFSLVEQLGSGANTLASGIALDSSGAIYTTGSFTGMGNFNPGAGTDDLSSSGGSNAYVSKLDATGNFVVANQIGSGAATQGAGIAVDGNGDIYTTGSFTGIGNFDPGIGSFPLTSTNTGANSSAFVDKLTQPPSLGSLSTTSGASGTPFSGTITITNGVTPYSDVAALNLPSGLMASLSGNTITISGTPTVSGNFNDVEISVNDAAGNTGTATYSISLIVGITLTPSSLPSGEVGVNYNQTITANGPSGPFTLTTSNVNNPTNLTITGSGTGTITVSGTPNTTGTVSFDVTPSSSAGTGSTTLYSFNVIAGVVLSPSSLPNGEVGVGYNQSITATGGSGTITLNTSNVNNPSNLTINGSGTGTITVTGTPTSTGTISFDVTPTDSIGTGATTVYSFSVIAGVTLSPSSLPTGEVGVNYNQTITASGGSGSITLNTSNVNNPTNLTIAGSGSGTITVIGTPTSTGTVSFDVTPTDSIGTGATTVYSFSVIAGVTLSPTSLPSGEVGVNYNQSITASGGSGSITLSTSNVNNPTGLNINGSGTGTITVTGIPTATGTVSFDVTPTDSIGTGASTLYSFSVIAGVALTPSSLPTGEVGVNYNQSITGSGGSGTITLSTSNVNNPTNLSINGSGTGTITVTGTPTSTGTVSFDVTPTDNNGAGTSTLYSFNVIAGVTLTPSSLPNGQLNVAYNQTITGSGGSGTITLNLTNISNPTGLNIGGNGTGTITLTGTPTSTGTVSFDVTPTDGIGTGATTQYSFNVINMITISPASLPNGQVGVAYSQMITASGGTPPVTFAITSQFGLPPGLMLNPNGLLNGMTLIPGTFPITVTATDSTGLTGSIQYTLIVTPAPAITLSPASLPSGQAGIPYSQTITASGGIGAPFTFAITSQFGLPPGLKLNPNGVINGSSLYAGTFPITITATDGIGDTGSMQYTLIMTPAPAITLSPASLPSGQAGVFYSQTISASGGAGSLTFAITSNFGLPPGLMLNPNGTITGSTTYAGTFPITVTATDIEGDTGSMQYTLIVTPGNAARISFLAQIASVGLNEPMAPIQVLVTDQFGNGINGAVNLYLVSPAGTFLTGAFATVNAVNGIATFTGVTLSSVGDFYLVAQSGIVSVESNLFEVMNTMGRHSPS